MLHFDLVRFDKRNVLEISFSWVRISNSVSFLSNEIGEDSGVNENWKCSLAKEERDSTTYLVPHYTFIEIIVTFIYFIVLSLWDRRFTTKGFLSHLTIAITIGYFVTLYRLFSLISTGFRIILENILKVTSCLSLVILYKFLKIETDSVPPVVFSSFISCNVIVPILETS